MKKLFFIFVSVFLFLSQNAIAQNTKKETFGIERYLNIRSASSPQLSPKGDRVAFLTNISGTQQVWMIDAKGGWAEQLTFYTDNVSFVAWSPDGKWLLFGKAKGGDENAQLFLMLPDGSQIKQLTDYPRVRHNFGGWSHDSKRIAYASNKRDKNFFDIYVMDVYTGAEELVYQQDGSNGVAAWSLNDAKLIVSRASEEFSLDNNLYLVDLKTKEATHITPHEGAAQFGDVSFAPNGSTFFYGTNDRREFYSLAEYDLRTKKVFVIDETQWDLDASEVSPHGDFIAYTINREGFSELYVRELETDGKPLITTVLEKGKPITLPGKGIVSGLVFSEDGSKLAFVFSGARYNADIWIYDTKTKSLSQVTRSSRAGIPQSSFVEPELIHYKTFDGREIPAWYYKPSQRPFTQLSGRMGLSYSFSAKPSSSSQLPVIVSVHGGPEGQERPGFSAVNQYFLSRGYAILAPNVRGSTGYGKAYSHLDDIRNREDSVKDLAYAVEWLKTQGGADPKRIAVMGGSYGGYMTLAAITLYPDLWAAAVDTVGPANFETLLKNTSGYRRKQREVEYGFLDKDLEFLRSISPIYKVDRIKTPLMVIHGKNDPRVPYTESEQIVKALRDRNAIVEYKLFDDEGHGVAKLANRLIVYPLIADFLDKYMMK
jgi:dipeptidyl aminopeptidase/acylaminoacyl peptidase